MAKKKPTWLQQLSGGHWVTYSSKSHGGKVHAYVRDADDTVIAGPPSWIGAKARVLSEHHARQPGAAVQHLLPDEEPPGLGEETAHNPNPFELGRVATEHAYTVHMGQLAAKARGEELPAGQGGVFPAPFQDPAQPHAAPAPPPSVAPAPPAAGGGTLEAHRQALGQAHDDFLDFAAALDRWYPGTAWEDLPAEDRAEYDALKEAYHGARQTFLAAAPPGDYDPRGEAQEDASGTVPPAPEAGPAAEDGARSSGQPRPDALSRIAEEMGQGEDEAAFRNPNAPRPLTAPAPAVLPPAPQPPEVQQGLFPTPVRPDEAERVHAQTTARFLESAFPAARGGIRAARTTAEQLAAVASVAQGEPAQKARTLERVGNLAAARLRTAGFDSAVAEHLLAHTAHAAAGLRGDGGTNTAPPGEEGTLTTAEPGPGEEPFPPPGSSERLSTRGEDVGDAYLGDLSYRDRRPRNTPQASRLRQKAGFLGGRLKAVPASGEEGEIDLAETPAVQRRQEDLVQRLGEAPGGRRHLRRKQTPEQRAAWERAMQANWAQGQEKYGRDVRARFLGLQQEQPDPELQNQLDHLESPAGHGALRRALEEVIPQARATGQMAQQQQVAGAAGKRARARLQQQQGTDRYASKEEGDLSLLRDMLQEYGAAVDPDARFHLMHALESRIRAGELRGLPLPPAPGRQPGLRQQELAAARAHLAERGDPRADLGARPEDLPIGRLHETPQGRAHLRDLVEGTFARHDIENDLHRGALADLAGALHKEHSTELTPQDLEAIQSGAGLLRAALGRTRQGAPPQPPYKPDHAQTGHQPYREMAGDRPGEPGVQALDDLVYNARKAHERGTHPLAPAQYEHLRKLSSALYRLKQVKVPQSGWARDALRDVHTLLPGAEAFLNAHNPAHEPHRGRLQQAAEHIFASDPDAPSLAHIGEMMGQHGGRLRLPERPAQPEGAQTPPEGQRGSAPSRSGLLDDVLGGLAGELGGAAGAQEAPAQHEAGGAISIPLGPRARAAEGEGRPQTLAAARGGAPQRGLLDDVLDRMAQDMGGDGGGAAPPAPPRGGAPEEAPTPEDPRTGRLAEIRRQIDQEMAKNAGKPGKERRPSARLKALDEEMQQLYEEGGDLRVAPLSTREQREDLSKRVSRAQMHHRVSGGDEEGQARLGELRVVLDRVRAQDERRQAPAAADLGALRRLARAAQPHLQDAEHAVQVAQERRPGPGRMRSPGDYIVTIHKQHAQGNAAERDRWLRALEEQHGPERAAEVRAELGLERPTARPVPEGRHEALEPLADQVLQAHGAIEREVTKPGKEPAWREGPLGDAEIRALGQRLGVGTGSRRAEDVSQLRADLERMGHIAPDRTTPGSLRLTDRGRAAIAPKMRPGGHAGALDDEGLARHLAGALGQAPDPDQLAQVRQHLLRRGDIEEHPAEEGSYLLTDQGRERAGLPARTDLPGYVGGRARTYGGAIRGQEEAPPEEPPAAVVGAPQPAAGPGGGFVPPLEEGTAPEVVTEPSGQQRMEAPAQSRERPVFGQVPPSRKGARLRSPAAGEGGIQPRPVGPSQQRQQQQEAQGFLFGNMGQGQGGTQLGFATLGPTEEKPTGPVQTGFLDLPPAEQPPAPPAAELPTARKEPGFIDRAAAALRNADAERTRAKGAQEEKETGPVQGGFLDLPPQPAPEPLKAPEPEPEPKKEPEPAEAPPVPRAAGPAPAPSGPARYPQWDEEGLTRTAGRGGGSPLERLPLAQQQAHAAQALREHAAQTILRGGVATLPSDEDEETEEGAPRKRAAPAPHPSEVMPFMYRRGDDLPPRERHAANLMWHRAGTPAEQVATLARYAHGFAPRLGRPPEARDPGNATSAERAAQRQWALRSARMVRSTLGSMLDHLAPEGGAGSEITSLQAKRYRHLSDALLWHAQNEGRLPDHKEFATLYGASESGRLEDEGDPVNHEHVAHQLDHWKNADAEAVARHADELHQYAQAGHDMADGRPGHPRLGPGTLFEAAKRLGALSEHKRLWDPHPDLSDALVAEHSALEPAARKEQARELRGQARKQQFLDHPQHGPINPGTVQHAADRLMAGETVEPPQEEPPEQAPAAPAAPPAGGVDVAALERGAQAHSEALAGAGASLESASKIARSQAAMRHRGLERDHISQSPHVNLVRQPGGYKQLYDQADHAYKQTTSPEKRLRLGLLRTQLHEIANDPTLSEEERQWQLDHAALNGHGLDDELEDARQTLGDQPPKGPPESPEEHQHNVERRARGLGNELREVHAHLREVGDGPLVRPAQPGDRDVDQGRNWRLYSDADLHAAHLERDLSAMRRAKSDHPVVKDAEEGLSQVYGNFLRHNISEARTHIGQGRGGRYISLRRLRETLAESRRKMALLRPDHPLLKEAQAAHDELDEKIGVPLGAEDLRDKRKAGEEASPYEQAVRQFHEDRARRGLPPAAGAPKEQPVQPAQPTPPAQTAAPPTQPVQPTAPPAQPAQPRGAAPAQPAAEGVNHEHVQAIVQRSQGLERGDLQRQIDAFHKVVERGEAVAGHGGAQVTPETAAAAAQHLEGLRDKLEARGQPATAPQPQGPVPKVPAPSGPAPQPVAGPRTAAEKLGRIEVGHQLETPHGRMWVSHYHAPSGTVRGEVKGKMMALNLHEHGPGDVHHVAESARVPAYINPLVA